MHYTDLSASCQIIVSHRDATVATDRHRQQPEGALPLIQ